MGYVSVICVFCGSQFSTRNHHPERGKGITCGNICAAKYRGLKQIKNIPVLTQAIKILSRKSVDEKTGCWNWIGATRKGYGATTVKYPGDKKKTMIGVHRLSYMLSSGRLDLGKLLVCHKCDNPLCFNPDHLFLGTALENSVDMVSKGRVNRVYTDDDIILMRKMSVNEGKSASYIGRFLNIHSSYVSRLLKNRSLKSPTL